MVGNKQLGAQPEQAKAGVQTCPYLGATCFQLIRFPFILFTKVNLNFSWCHLAVVAQCRRHPQLYLRHPRVARHLFRPKFRCDTSRELGGEGATPKFFRGCGATPLLHLQDAIKSRKAGGTRNRVQLSHGDDGVQSLLCGHGFSLFLAMLVFLGLSSFGMHARCNVRRKKKYTPKVFSALKTHVPQRAKKRFGCLPKSLFSREKKEKTYTPKSLPGVGVGPLRTVLVYRFWPPKCVC